MVDLIKLDIPSERLLEVFGHTRPKQTEVEAFREMIWQHSISNERNIKRSVLVRNVSILMDDLGFYPILDYQIRERQIRFSAQPLLASALMGGLYDFIIAEQNYNKR
jgi:hypothetical protein